MKKSDWKRTVKDKIQNQIQERVEKEMENKTKLRTVREDKWERKEYITTCDSDDSKNDAIIFLIRKFYCFRKGQHIYFKYA